MNGIIHLKTVQSKLQLNFVPDTDYLLITEYNNGATTKRS